MLQDKVYGLYFSHTDSEKLISIINKHIKKNDLPFHKSEWKNIDNFYYRESVQDLGLLFLKAQKILDDNTHDAHCGALQIHITSMKFYGRVSSSRENSYL